MSQKKPTNDDLSTFAFNANLAQLEIKSLEDKISTIETRIDRIVEKTLVNNTQVLGYIIKFASDPAELRLLSRALSGVAPLLQELEDLKPRLIMLQYIVQHPNYIASVFGDFSGVFEDIDPLQFK